VVESIKSILPVCDEFVIAVGDSEDGTLELIKSINPSKIKIIETVWDESLREGGKILSQQTNVALENITGDWGFYLQADEVIHEKYLPILKKSIEENLNNKNVEGLLLKYKHFYGSYDYIGTSRKWYRHEIRIVRNNAGIKSWGDAQGFRINGRKMKVKLVDAFVYHYGWVKPPKIQQEKQKYFNKLWHDDKWLKKNVSSDEDFNYHKIDILEKFTEAHPEIMKERIVKSNWDFKYDTKRNNMSLKNKILHKIEEFTDVRIGEYKNYELLKKKMLDFW
jgi:hypothetical protein